MNLSAGWKQPVPKRRADVAAARKRRKKPPKRQAVFTLRRIVVAGLATAVFAAALILNTEALITLPVACAAGACGQTAKWAVRACAALVLAAVAVAIIRRWRASAARRRPASGRRSTRKPARKPAAARPPAKTGAAPDRGAKDLRQR